MAIASVVPVVIAGGSGTRLWPLSREAYPKQFLKLTHPEHSFFQETLMRVKGCFEQELPPLVICNNDHRFLVAEQMRQLGMAHMSIILEPKGRNTAPAIAVAALKLVQAGYGASVMLALPADHFIGDVAALRQAFHHAAKLAQSGRLITFGVVPTHPETGYGYIKSGEPDERAPEQAKRVAQFVEKPDLETATQYLAAQCYFWNSGMFAFTADAYLKALGDFRPDIMNACRLAFDGAYNDLDFLRLDTDAFLACPADSIDYAVMEKTDAASVIPLDCGWNDVGSWSALGQVLPQDERGNAVHGDVLMLESEHCLVQSHDKAIAMIGVDHLAVVDTPDALLIAHMDKVQQVKEVVNLLKAEGRSEHRHHRKVYRPWGWYDSVDVGLRHQVKHICVKPGATLSLQMHHHRSEHWIVVKGTAKVTEGEKTYIITENQSTYIPLGVKHRLENPGILPLEMIEVQCGSYVGEDDILRFEDNYGRT